MGRGRRRWLVRVFLGRDRETRRRRYLSRTVHGPVRQAQTYLNKVLRERDLNRLVEGAEITLNEYFDRWLETAAKPRLREKSYQSYQSLLLRYIRPVLGERILSVISPLDVQSACQKMVERGLSARTIRYTSLRSAFRHEPGNPLAIAARRSHQWRPVATASTTGDASAERGAVTAVP